MIRLKLDQNVGIAGMGVDIDWWWPYGKEWVNSYLGKAQRW